MPELTYREAVRDALSQAMRSDDELAAIEQEVQELVEGAVEFAKAGTDPKPEDALKNVYA